VNRSGPGSHELIVAADAADLARRGAAWIAERLAQAAARTGRASIALAGGNTPRPVYQALAKQPLPWSEIEFYFGDERCVPPDHVDSNCRMARETLFDVAPIPPDNVHRIPAEREDREAAAAEYAAILPDELDVILLGMGEDSHTASLFPGTDWGRGTGRKVIVVASPKPPPFRLTVTPDVIAGARQRLVMVTGADKARQVKQALRGGYNPYLYPIQIARHGTWLLDQAAARDLMTEGGDYV
jgi:6-phosphogluconolactonase